MGKKECRYATSSLDVEYIYAHLYNQFTAAPHNLVKACNIASQVGSPLLQKVREMLESVWSWTCLV